jgi:major vault protein
MKLSYRVNFEGDPARRFDVENYVKFLTDHLRSRLRHAVTQHGVEAFYLSAVTILRDVILGAAVDGAKRPVRLFEENGMPVYDAEVLDVTLGDASIATTLVDAQHAAVEQTLSLAAEQRRLELTRQTEETRQKIAELQSFSDRALAERMAERMAPLAILGGESVASVLARLLEGMAAAKALRPREG